jgi:hypothetical protein
MDQPALPYKRERHGSPRKAAASLAWGVVFGALPFLTFARQWGALMASEVILLSAFVLPGAWSLFSGLERILFVEIVEVTAERVTRRRRRLWHWAQLSEPLTAYAGVALVPFKRVALIHALDPMKDVEVTRGEDAGPWADAFKLPLLTLEHRRAALSSHGLASRAPMAAAGTFTAVLLGAAFLIGIAPLLKMIGIVMGAAGLFFGDPLLFALMN